MRPANRMPKAKARETALLPSHTALLCAVDEQAGLHGTRLVKQGTLPQVFWGETQWGVNHALLKVCPSCGSLYDPALFPRGHTCPGRLVLRAQLNSGAWRKQRAAHLRAYPGCADCAAEGTITPATVAHHPHRRAHGGPLLTTDLMSLCASHHNTRTQRGQ